jgi:hypothetical protein
VIGKLTLFFAAFSLLSCGSAQDLSGRYVSIAGQPAVQLELERDGKGEWATDIDAVPVKWEVRGGEVWLHTKAGGVLKGTIKGGTLVFDLPGTPAFTLQRKGK